MTMDITPEELDRASIANEAKNQRIRELEEALLSLFKYTKDFLGVRSDTFLTCSEDNPKLFDVCEKLLHQKQ